MTWQNPAQKFGFEGEHIMFVCVFFFWEKYPKFESCGWAKVALIKRVSRSREINEMHFTPLWIFVLSNNFPSPLLHNNFPPDYFSFHFSDLGSRVQYLEDLEFNSIAITVALHVKKEYALCKFDVLLILLWRHQWWFYELQILNEVVGDEITK